MINIVQCHLRVKDADKQIAFLRKAFEAKEIKRFKLPDGSVVHAEIRIGDSAIMLSKGLANSIFWRFAVIAIKNALLEGGDWTIGTLVTEIYNKPIVRGWGTSFK